MNFYSFVVFTCCDVVFKLLSKCRIFENILFMVHAVYLFVNFKNLLILLYFFFSNKFFVILPIIQTIV